MLGGLRVRASYGALSLGAGEYYRYRLWSLESVLSVTGYFGGCSINGVTSHE